MTAMLQTLLRIGCYSVIFFLVVILSTAPLDTLSADVEGGPGGFIRDFSDRAILKLTKENASEREKEQSFRTLVKESFDIYAIGRFVLGRYWRRASKAQRLDFMTTFEDMLVHRFLPLFAKHKGETLKIGLVRPFSANTNFFSVSTRLELEGTEPIQVNWRVRKAESRYKIVDVIAEGVSYALTLRSEYAAVLKQNGGDVNALIQTMRKASASF